MGEGITSLHHLHYSIPVSTFSSVVMCFELKTVGMLLLHARNPGYLFFLYRAVTCLYTAKIKVRVRRTYCMLGTRLPEVRVLCLSRNKSVKLRQKQSRWMACFICSPTKSSATRDAFTERIFVDFS